MALSLARQESERIIDAVKEKVDNLVKAGNMDPNVLRDLRSDLRNHIFQQSDWQTFEQAFKTTNPDFIPRLYNRCKSLSPMQVKLASLILVGMSIKEIAGYLNIKEDSVMQARWRLRNKLGLTKEDPIEEFLHRINNGLE